VDENDDDPGLGFTIRDDDFLEDFPSSPMAMMLPDVLFLFEWAKQTVSKQTPWQ
jgi:hypothetical protein